MTHRQQLRGFAAVLVLILLSGCAGGSAESQPSATTAAGRQPLTIDNCGRQVTVGARPERIVTIKSSATEAVLALGARSRLVGTAASDGPIPPAIATSAPPVISSEVPSAESVLGLAPDLIYAGWESNLTAKTAGDRAQLAQLGIATFISPAACEDRRYRPERLSYDDVFAEIEQVGQLIGAPENATALVDAQRAQLSNLTPSGQDRTALWYSSGSTTPYVGAGSGAPQMIMSKVGLRNIAADVDDSWTSLGWEAIADRQPDVIILVDATWNTAETKIKLLKSNPTTAALPAVENDRFLHIDFAATQPGVRNVEATVDLAGQLSRIP